MEFQKIVVIGVGNVGRRITRGVLQVRGGRKKNRLSPGWS